jgi:tetratricopeptide (TPR) repeat protein
MPDADQQTAVAERALGAARQLIAAQKYWDAIQLLEQALPRTEPDSRLRHALQVQLASAYMANPKWMKRAEEMLQEVVTGNPTFTEAYFALGRLYKEKGLKVRAERMFRRVLEIDPKNAVAAAELPGAG